jgi:hypothetical protein
MRSGTATEPVPDVSCSVVFMGGGSGRYGERSGERGDAFGAHRNSWPVARVPTSSWHGHSP